MTEPTATAEMQMAREAVALASARLDDVIDDLNTALDRLIELARAEGAVSALTGQQEYTIKTGVEGGEMIAHPYPGAVFVQKQEAIDVAQARLAAAQQAVREASDE